MLLLNILRDPMWQPLSQTLLHFIWQGLLVAAAVATVLHVWPVRKARSRYFIFLSALLAVAACPIVTLLVTERSDVIASLRSQPEAFFLSDASTEDDRNAAVSKTNAHIVPVEQPIHDNYVPLDRFEAAESAAPDLADVSSPPTWRTRLIRISDVVQPYCLLVWMSGVLVLAIRLCLSYLKVRWIARDCAVIPSELAAKAKAFGRRLRLNSLPRVCVSNRIRDAIVVGVWRPLVLLPTSWLTEMPPEVLEAVLAHELAHIRRFDLWVNLLQRLIETLLFFHPAVWWLSRQVSVAREMCTDEMAVGVTSDRLTYATALEQLGRLRISHTMPQLTANMGDSKMMLLKRVTNILEVATPRERVRWLPAGLLAMAIPTAILFTSLTVGSPRESRATAVSAEKDGADTKAPGIADPASGENNELSWGPVIERTIGDPRRAALEKKHRCIIDFDTGRVAAWPVDGLQAFDKSGGYTNALKEFVREHGLDAVGRSDGDPDDTVGLVSFGMWAIEVENDQWQMEPHRVIQGVADRLGGIGMFLLGMASPPEELVIPWGKRSSVGEDLPRRTTYLFETREGSRGILQIVEVASTTTFRYKLVMNTKDAASKRGNKETAVENAEKDDDDTKTPGIADPGGMRLAPDWGKTVNGVRMRVTEPRFSVVKGERIDLRVDIHNGGQVNRSILKTEAWELEIDGEWLKATGGTPGDRFHLPLAAGQTRRGLKLSALTNLGFGKHTLRVACHLYGDGRSKDVPRIRIVSQPVEFEVIDDLPLDRLIQLAGITLVNDCTNPAELPDLFVDIPPESGSYEVREEVIALPCKLKGDKLHSLSSVVFYVPSKNTYYIQQDRIGSSTLTFYGPFPGDPRNVINTPLLGRWESAIISTPWGTGRLQLECTAAGKLTYLLVDPQSGKPSASGKGIWSVRSGNEYEFAFDANHPNAPGVGVLELHSAETVMTVTTSDGPTPMTIQLQRLEHGHSG